MPFLIFENCNQIWGCTDWLNASSSDWVVSGFFHNGVGVPSKSKSAWLQTLERLAQVGLH
jgi:hypothetical protein